MKALRRIPSSVGTSSPNETKKIVFGQVATHNFANLTVVAVAAFDGLAIGSSSKYKDLGNVDFSPWVLTHT